MSYEESFFMKTGQDTEEIQSRVRISISKKRNMSKFVMTIFGASGDLTKRKLMPALYSLYVAKRLPGRI